MDGEKKVAKKKSSWLLVKKGDWLFRATRFISIITSMLLGFIPIIVASCLTSKDKIKDLLNKSLGDKSKLEIDSKKTESDVKKQKSKYMDKQNKITSGVDKDTTEVITSNDEQKDNAPDNTTRNN